MTEVRNKHYGQEACVLLLVKHVQKWWGLNCSIIFPNSASNASKNKSDTCEGSKVFIRRKAILHLALHSIYPIYLKKNHGLCFVY